MNIVFNINRLALEGLGATLSSLCRNCLVSNNIRITFLHTDLSDSDKGAVENLMKQENYQGSIDFKLFDAKKNFGQFRSLHGDWTAYGRLLIPEIFSNELNVIYLDSDLIINFDVNEFEPHFIAKEAISAVIGSEVKWALENKFLINIAKIPENKNYFNSGVLVFNIPAWHEEKLSEKWRSFPTSYYDEFRSADQTILNVLIKGNFHPLPKTFNNAWNPDKPEPEKLTQSIVHFVGSPKPWDLFGKFIHQGYPLFSTYNPDFWKKKYNQISKDKLKRTYKIKKSILRILIKKITS